MQRSFIRRAAGVAVLMCVLFGSFLRAEAADAALPGPYPVGVTTVMLVDHSRTDPATKGPRHLLTEIWYPATDDSTSLSKNKLSDFLLRGQAPSLLLAFRAGFNVKIEDLDNTFQNASFRDARVRDGKFPLLVFSHGNGGVRFQSTFWCDHLASHGYVVMSPDHTGNSAATVVDGKIVLSSRKGGREQSAMDRPRDVSFLIDTMLRWAKGEDSRFAGRIHADRIGVAGHSFGGYTSGAIINTDERVRAIVPMTPIFGERTRYDVPLLLVVAGEDKTIGTAGNENSRNFFNESTGPRIYLNIKDAGHFSFSDMAQFRPDFGDGVGQGERITKPGEPLTYIPVAEAQKIANAYSVAFLGLYLNEDESWKPYLETNHFGDAVEFISELDRKPAAVEAGETK